MRRSRRRSRPHRPEYLVGVARVDVLIDGYDASIAWVDSEFGKILSLLRGKKLYDKREDLKKREAGREMAQAFKERQRK